MKQAFLLVCVLPLIAGLCAQNPVSTSDVSGLFPVMRDWKAGYIDRTGRIVIPLQYALATPFSGGLAAVSPDWRLWGYIDVSGRMVIEPQFAIATPFAEDLA